ncbi:hypothetical protein [Fortiea contorta]|uniref:hypothetical protein n=1 Tax=Fortiea contorta TaxID=1892405 RepID=UPI00034B7605|nr:hypothetical protein [Fortiea contorta]
MLFVFAPVIQAGIKSGVYEIVRNTATGQLLGIARDKVTGKFVAHAVGIASEAIGVPLNTVFAPAQLVMGGLQMLQTHLGFQKTYKMLETLQNSVGVLQATTSVIGVGTVAVGVLSAVNLYQTMKLREDVKQLRLEVQDGFINLKQALRDQGAEIIQRINQVAEDIKFENHRLVLIQAYGQFQEALMLIKTALLCKDQNIKNDTLGGARLILTNALANYNNPHLLDKTSAAGHLRRVECAWSIEQAIALTFQLQNQSAAVSDRLSYLQHKIRQDCLTVIEKCESEEELDFIFPEILCIRNNDLAVLESWQNHVDWIQTLSADERQLLASSHIQSANVEENKQEVAVVSEPEELAFYENLKQKSHYLSLRDQLIFMIKPDLRRQHESYINQQALKFGYQGFAPSNWQKIPDLTVGNLYWYFKVKDKSNV